MKHFALIHRSGQLPAQVAAKIAERIEQCSLAPGDKLPTEHALAKSFGVSRSVVREAVAQLRHEGFVHSRQGVGIFVADAQQRQSIRIEQDALRDPQSFFDLFQLRVPLEIEAAGLAARRRSEAQLEEIERTLAEMNGVHKWTEEGIVADLAFHRALTLATNNTYFTTFLGFIAERIGTTISAARSTAVLEEIVEITIAEHTVIRDAIAAKDVAAARVAMHRHIVNAAGRLGLRLEDERR